MVHDLGCGFRADLMPSLASEGLSGMKQKCVGYVWGPGLWDFSPLPTGRSIQLCLETAIPRDWQEKESWINNILSFLHLQNFEILMGKTCPATMVPTSVHCAKQVLNIF